MFKLINCAKPVDQNIILKNPSDREIVSNRHLRQTEMNGDVLTTIYFQHGLLKHCFHHNVVSKPQIVSHVLAFFVILSRWSGDVPYDVMILSVEKVPRKPGCYRDL